MIMLSESYKIVSENLYSESPLKSYVSGLKAVNYDWLVSHGGYIVSEAIVVKRWNTCGYELLNKL